MAGARLEKVGTIFSRVSGLLKRDVFKTEDKPIWHEIYALHPPYEEPRYDRPAPEMKVKEILYAEDTIRAQFHKDTNVNELIRLADTQHKTRTQRFIELYSKYQDQGALDDQKIFEVALQQLHSEHKSEKSEKLEDEISEHVDFGLASRFAEAINENKSDEQQKVKAPKKKEKSAVDINSLFK